MQASVIDRDRVGVDTPRGRTTVRRVRPYRAHVVVRPETFRGRLRRLRLERGWSLRDLARESGLGFGAVGMIERGDSMWPTAYTVGQLARALGVSMDALFLGETS